MSTDSLRLDEPASTKARREQRSLRLTPRTAFVTFLLGTFLAQLAWIVALPAFAGIDEIEHTYKAAAVAHGGIMPVGPSPHGRGELVAVPGDIVTAAETQCSSLRYTKHDNCHAVDHLGYGMVTVASAAARYNPAFYLVVGTVARPFHGDAALYAMRITTGILCALLIGWAAAVITAWSRTRWPLMGLVLATTPVLIYSTAISSPNGVSYAAGLLVWAAVLGLVRYDAAKRPTLLLTSLATGSATLVLTHTTGPLWLALILIVGFLLRTPREWWRLVTGHRRALLATAAVVAAFTIASVAWTSLSGANSLAADLPDQSPLTAGELVTNQILWVFQSVAAFPLRNERAPLAVYVCWLVPMTAALVLGMVKGRSRERLAIVLLVVLAFAVPTVLTLVSYPYIGLAWQGRYGLPLTVGLFLIAGLILDRRRTPAHPVFVVVLGALTASAGMISVAHVALTQIHGGFTQPVASVVPGGIVLVVGLAVLGSLLPVAALLRPHEDQDSPDLTDHPRGPGSTR